MKKDSRIYIAGHRGLVGSAILRRLQTAGYTNYTLRPHRELDLEIQKDVWDFFEEERPEYVFLAAAKVGGILANNTYPADFIYNNLLIQVNVIKAAHAYGVKKLLFLGSSCIYPKFAPQPMKEEYLLTGPLEPTNEPYAVAKIAGIKLCQSYNRQYKTNFISVMPTNLYGPNDNFDLNSSHVLPAMIRKFHEAKVAMQQGEKQVEGEEKVKGGSEKNVSSHTLPMPGSGSVVLWGTGSPYREFLHVDDLADACVFLMEQFDSSSLPLPCDPCPVPGLINIGTGQDITIKELAEMIKGIVGFEGEIVWDSSKPDGTPRKLLDVSMLKALGWRPKITLEEGIKSTFEWYVENEKAKD
jgi:GDP-L-fucose synthase